MTRPRRDPDPDGQLPGGIAAPGPEARMPAGPPGFDPPPFIPPDIEPPDTEWPEPEWPDPSWPGFGPTGRPSHWFTLEAWPSFKERYPDKAANLFDALHAGRAPQPAPEPARLADRQADRQADWEAGE